VIGEVVGRPAPEAYGAGSRPASGRDARGADSRSTSWHFPWIGSTSPGEGCSSSRG